MEFSLNFNALLVVTICVGFMISYVFTLLRYKTKPDSPVESRAIVAQSPILQVDPTCTPKAKKPKQQQPPGFPFLKISNLVPGGTPASFKPNTRESIKFDSDFVKGEMFVMLRTQPVDPEYQWVFEKKRRYFELHFKVQFKVQPRGIIYLGGELPAKMRLGMTTDLACKAILGVVKRLSFTLHASFGDANGEELPHIVFPLWHAADRLVLSKPGDVLPEIGKGPIPEPDASRLARFKDASLGRSSISKGDTVTFSFHSAYVDFVEWKLRGLGAIRDQNLSLFWDTMPLRVVVYDVLPEVKKHTRDAKRFFLAFELKNTWHERAEDDEQVLWDDEEDDEEEIGVIMEMGNRGSEDDEDDDGRDVSSDPVAMPGSISLQTKKGKFPGGGFSKSPSSSSLGFRPQKILAMIKRKTVILGRRRQDGGGSFSHTSPSHGAVAAVEGGFDFFPEDEENTSLPLLDGIAQQGLMRVVGWVRLMYSREPIFIVSFTEESTTAEMSKIRMLLRTCDEIRECLDSAPTSKWFFVVPSSHALTDRWMEGLRKRLDRDAKLAAIETGGITIQGMKDERPQSWFSTRRRTVVSKRFVGPDVGRILLQSMVWRVVSDAQWQEEWLVIMQTGDENSLFLLFFRESKTPICILAASSVSHVRMVDSPPDRYANNWFLLELDTLLKVKLVCFPTAESRQRVYDAMEDAVTGRRRKSTPESIPSSFLFAIDTNAASIDETRRWGKTKRFILNTRLLQFFSKTEDLEIQNLVGNPVELSADLLVRASCLAGSSLKEQCEFFNRSCLFRKVDLFAWSQAASWEEKASFFLNLYHALLAHARFLVGHPTSATRFGSFSKQMSYEFGSVESNNACVLSLAEIEHRILRSHSSALSTTFFSGPGVGNSNTYETVPPATITTSSLALYKVDARLNFALNRANKSCASFVMVYRPAALNEQLNRSSMLFLDEALTVDLGKRKIYLPKVCELHACDFDLITTGSGDISAWDMTGLLLPWLSAKKKPELFTLLPPLKVSWKNGTNSGSRRNSDLVTTVAGSYPVVVNPMSASTSTMPSFSFKSYDWQPRDSDWTIIEAAVN